MQAPKKRELFHIAGDPEHGYSATMDLTSQAAGHPVIFYKDRVLVADVYALPDEPMYIHLLCPFSTPNEKHGLRISQERKLIEYDPAGIVPPPPNWTQQQLLECFPQGLGGLLNVEEFSCTWEAEPELRRQFGMSMCPWKVVIENNVARDV